MVSPQKGADSMNSPLLVVDQCTVTFGGLIAVNNLSFNLNRGELLGIIGPNGAGQTTAPKVIPGLYRPSHGPVRLNGQPIIDLKPQQVNALVIGRTFLMTCHFADL